ncbi:MAG: ECF transporter S component [Bacilli bacterium]|nr:ECF transporter S component [Bacilli bacterium]
MQNKQVRWIVQTALFIALLVVIQFATASLGNTLITGSLVNLILIISVLSCGLQTGAFVAILSPILAKLVGIGPLWTIIPFVMLGNLVLVIIYKLVYDKVEKNIVGQIILIVGAALVKTLVLYLGIVKIMVPLVLQLPAKQATIISTMFSFPQFITATIGGVIALIVFSQLKKTLK